MPKPLSRRAFLGAAGGLGLLAVLPPSVWAGVSAAGPPTVGQAGRFLTAAELDALRAMCHRFVPGPPDDPDPGAREAGCPEAIDLLLGAFTLPVPPIHAGGPFSGRAPAGAVGTHDDFADFVPLDAVAELGWRIRIEGSLGRPEREFAGPVRGWQQVYREGLAHLDHRAAPLTFASLPGPAQDAILSDQSDATVQELVGIALGHTIDAMYGPPEYGGNKGLAGWTPIGWAGDVQPRGYTATQVSNLDPASLTLADRADALARFRALLPHARWRNR
ncbi:MAG: gluconate 2-dehydrogenase subunit 3 [Acidimicrobiales bacterium]|nr:gluconate 2-dehydrogenase subunit 3 [Acidimicrobiales bacterium]